MGDVSLKQRQTVPEALPLREILRLLPESRQYYFLVKDGSGRLVGVFSTDDVRLYLYDEALWQLAVARDIMITTLVSLVPDDDLNTAMRRFSELSLDELPVLETAETGKLLGMLRRKDGIAVYNRRLLERKQAALEHA